MIWGDVNLRVKAEDQPGPSRLNLILYNRAGRVVGRQTVTPHGRYRFTNLSPGEYELAIEAENGEITRIQFNLNGSAGSDYRQDLHFEWKNKSSRVRTKPGTISASDVYSRSSGNQELFQKAEEALDKKKYEQAVSFLTQIVSNDNLDFQAMTLLGIVRWVQKDFAAAEEAYSRALEVKPTFGLALINLGKLHSSQKNYEAAIDPLTRAVQSQPQSAEANLLLGEAYLQTRKGSQAVPYLQAAAKLGRPEAHLRLGWLFNAAGMKDKAALEYESFLRKVPDYSNRKALLEYISSNKN